ncbi:gluconate 2-dehydrogenase subunit 3 family protein [Pseudoduganella lutea]|uniref:Gluconate 2-dehydrogenase subunit 3 family protein n=1 Tax=Pseudoduganella lutea TaxID=321985 RepID=A0A4P6L5U9_9BURK|nr:gluconate 2-dehydrogenase subunit 3 family protein [Pseudoduganella lutea]QBE66917.1 gluconate 2-dehydrogenase subunit 3 family protein [Pseudoduganella lutea]
MSDLHDPRAGHAGPLPDVQPGGRRGFLRGTATVALSSVLLPSQAAASGRETRQAPLPAAAYRPVYFTPNEWAFILAAVDRLIPDDGNGPGGVAAGVPEFLDRQMELPYGHGAYWYMQGPFHPDSPATLGYQLRLTPRELYRAGIAAADRASMALHGTAFAGLRANQRDTLLAALEQGSIPRDGSLAAAFFALLLKNTREGFFADPMYGGNRGMVAWKMIGFPGARADFTDWIDQPGKPYPYGPVAIDGSTGSIRSTGGKS